MPGSTCVLLPLHDPSDEDRGPWRRIREISLLILFGAGPSVREFLPVNDCGLGHATASWEYGHKVGPFVNGKLRRGYLNFSATGFAGFVHDRIPADPATAHVM